MKDEADGGGALTYPHPPYGPARRRAVYDCPRRISHTITEEPNTYPTVRGRHATRRPLELPHHH